MQMSDFTLMTFPFMMETARGKMTFDDVVRLAAETGFSYIDPTRITNNQVNEYLAILKKYHVSIYCQIEMVSLFSKTETIEKELRRQLEKAKRLNAQKLMIVPYKPVIDVRKAKKMGSQQTMETLVKGFTVAKALGDEVGLPVCFETTPHDILRLSGNADCKYILDHVPGLEFVFDTANMLPHGDDPAEAFALLHDRATHVHLKDVCLTAPQKSLMEQETTPDGKIMKCCAWGKGVVPVTTMYRQFKESGYAGKFAVEYARPHDGICSYEEHKEQIKKFLAEIR